MLLIWFENNFFYLTIILIAFGLVNESVNLSKITVVKYKNNFYKFILFSLLVFIVLSLLLSKISNLLFLNLFIIYFLITVTIYRYDIFTLFFLNIILISTVLSILIFQINPKILLYLIIINSVSDIGAYIFGNILKGPKIFPNISPNKTFSGSISAVFCSILISYYLQLSDNLYMNFILGLLISLFGQLGDLFESKYKRIKGVKDSGSFLPGHGGFLDRCDSLLFSIIFIFAPIYLNLI